MVKECEKLAQHIEEWNHVYPFMEWLQEHKIFLCRYQTEEEAKANNQIYEGKVWIRDDLFPIGKTIEQLLYEYFGIDPAKLERERREILENLRKQ